MMPDSPQWIAAKAEGDRAELAIDRLKKLKGIRLISLPDSD